MFMSNVERYMLNESILGRVETDDVVDNDENNYDRLVVRIMFNEPPNTVIDDVLERMKNMDYGTSVHIDYEIDYFGDDGDFINVVFYYKSYLSPYLFIRCMMYLINIICVTSNYDLDYEIFYIDDSYENVDGQRLFQCGILNENNEKPDVKFYIRNLVDLFKPDYSEKEIIRICTVFALHNRLLNGIDGYYAFICNDEDYFLIVDDKGNVVCDETKHIPCWRDNGFIVFVYNKRFIGVQGCVAGDENVCNIYDLETGKFMFKEHEITDLNFIEGTDIVAYEMPREYWTLMDIKKKKKILSNVLEFSRELGDGLIRVRYRNSDGELGTVFLDKDGNIAIDSFHYYDVGVFSEGYASVRLSNNSSSVCSTYIDKTGNVITDKTFYRCFAFYCGCAMVKKSKDVFSFVDKKCNYITDEEFSNCSNFVDGVAVVKLKDTGMMTIIDTKGKHIMKDMFLEIKHPSNGFSAVQNTGGRWNFIDCKKHSLVSKHKWFESIVKNFNEYGFAIVKDDGLMKIIDTSGKILLDNLIDVEYVFGYVVIVHIEDENRDDKINYYSVKKHRYLLDDSLDERDWINYNHIVDNEDNERNGYIVILNTDIKFNLIDKEGNLLLDEWSDELIDIYENGLLRIGLKTFVDDKMQLVSYI